MLYSKINNARKWKSTHSFLNRVLFFAEKLTFVAARYLVSTGRNLAGQSRCRWMSTRATKWRHLIPNLAARWQAGGTCSPPQSPSVLLISHWINNYFVRYGTECNNYIKKFDWTTNLFVQARFHSYCRRAQIPRQIISILSVPASKNDTNYFIQQI